MKLGWNSIWGVLAIGTVAAFVFFSVQIWNAPLGPRPEDLFAKLDPQYPGRGVETSSDEPVDFSMSYALFASAAALAGDEHKARLGADRLLLLKNSLGKPGWALPGGWDAFQDGSVNPAETAYGINTAVGVRALIDTWEMTKEDKYRREVVDALDYYAAFTTHEDSGTFFWYSDQSVDAIPVINVVSALMGQYARAARLWDREDYRRLADEAFAYVWSHRRVNWDGVHWAYSGLPTSLVNDSVHAAITVQGLIDYRDATGTEVDLEPAIAYLTTYLEVGASTDFSRSANVPFTIVPRPAQLWGLGMLAFTLANAGRYAEANIAAQEIERYLNSEVELDNRQFMHALLGITRLHYR